jgi:hypothetical protein
MASRGQSGAFEENDPVQKGVWPAPPDDIAAEDLRGPKTGHIAPANLPCHSIFLR